MQLPDIASWYEQHYPALTRQRHRWPDRRGEYWAICPFHADIRPGSFSFSERGYKCFSCGAHGSLRTLGEAIGLDDSRPAPAPRPRPRPASRTYSWQRDPEYWRRYLPLPDHARELYHGRGMSDDTIERWHLGYGVLPASRCRWPRLILPVFEGGRLVGLRGRRCHPRDTDDKWLCAAGSRTVLFGADNLAAGRTVIVTEAPFSAILAMQEAPHVVAVAGTAGAATWRDEWTRRIAESEPAWVLVWFDADEAGERAARRVCGALQAADLRVQQYHWNVQAPEHRDLADVVAETHWVPVAPPTAVLPGIGREYL